MHQSADDHSSLFNRPRSEHLKYKKNIPAVSFFKDILLQPAKFEF